MHLKSVEFFGFKSFADRTKIEFTPGISALLGPNGCGKSNIVDAVKWVLGEQSSKTLRAERMEDVIFNGSDGKKAMGVAEVTITLSSESEDLPLGLSELAVRRRLYRSGESAYFINGNPSKLREIRELFYDTGIGKSAYSVMEQGKIDQVLSNKPEERRSLFEEAAGITKYRAQGAEAERKLERTEENMRQAQILLNEVRRSYSTLEKQAAKTDRYRGHREELFEVELRVQLLKLRDLMERKNTTEEDVDSHSGKREGLRTQIDTIKRSLDEDMNLINTMEGDLAGSQKRLYTIEIDKNNRANDSRILEERKRELEQKMRQEGQRLTNITDKLGGLQSEEQAKRALHTELTERIQDVDANINRFRKDIEGFSNHIVQNEHGIRGIKQDVAAADDDLEALRGELRSITDDIVTQLDERLKESGYSYAEARHIEGTIEELIKTIQIHARGKAELEGDAVALGDLGAADLRGILESSLEKDRDIARRAEELGALFERYRGFSPSFLDDFLAPEGIITQKRGIDEKISAALQSIASLRERSEALSAENVELGKRIDEYRKTLEDLRVNRAQARSRRDSAEAELDRLGREIQEHVSLLARSREEIEKGKERLVDIDEQMNGLLEKITALGKEETRVKRALEKLEGEIGKRNRSLVSARRRLEGRSEDLERLLRRLEKVKVQLAETNAEIRAVYENFSETHSRDLKEYESGMYEIRESVMDSRDRLRTLREALKDLGHVNLMAPEEFAEVKERYDFLHNQLEDLRSARSDLEKVTEEIRTESTKRFLETYGLIRKNFHVMFRRLFEGGRADLRLTTPDDVLESGVEILAQPPGKKLENIALLSGGERSLTAIALLFGTYMVKPSPFCVLDEIDAALSEDNVVRFANLLTEFAKTSQFIIITHNKKTVTCANALYGITMEESGVSKLIAIRVDTGDGRNHA